MRQYTSLLLVLVAIAASAQGPYFPKGVLNDNSRSDENSANWYSKHLRALKEPSLLEIAKNPSLESYRFVWLRTFHHPVIVRVDINADGLGEVTSKMSSGEGGYDPGDIIENKSRTLTRAQTDTFLGNIKKDRFWDLPSYETNPDTIVMDGAQWIIEGIKGGKYHVVDRCSPGKGEVRGLGLAFIQEIAVMKIPRDVLY